MRVCVEGAPVTELGAGNGRAAVPGVSPEDTRVRVEVYDASGEMVLATEWGDVGDAVPVVELPPINPDNTPCTDDGEFAADTAASRLLVTRFAQE
jgi:hypothetical protein